MLGHVELGLRLIAAHAPASLEPERRLALEHCVIAPPRAEAPRRQRPATAEALALYRLNALDAQREGRVRAGLVCLGGRCRAGF